MRPWLPADFSTPRSPICADPSGQFEGLIPTAWGANGAAPHEAVPHRRMDGQTAKDLKVLETPQAAALPAGLARVPPFTF